MTDIARALAKQAKLDAEATAAPWVPQKERGRVAYGFKGIPGIVCQHVHSDACTDLIAHLRNQAALAREVIRAVTSAEHLIRQHLGPFGSPILNALKAWAEHVNGETP